MSFNDKYLKKFSIFKLELESYEKQDQKTFPENWIINQLQPVLIQFLGIWHGAEVRRLSFYLEEEPLKICGVVEFSKELRHKINFAKPEVFRITGQSLSFFPIDCDPLENHPVESWEELNAGKLIFRHYFEDTQNQNGLEEASDGTTSTVSPLKDLLLNVDKKIHDKKQRNQTRFTALHKTGHDLSVIFGGTCNVFIYKDTEHHKGELDFYGVLFEDIFTVATTPYKVLVFREGTFGTISKCRKEHHWFALGIDNNFSLLSFWKKNFAVFRHPKRSFHFERQGKILSQKQLGNAIKVAHDYLYPAVPFDEHSHGQPMTQSQPLPQSDSQIKSQVQPQIEPQIQSQVQPQVQPQARLISQPLIKEDPQVQVVSQRIIQADSQVQPIIESQVELVSQRIIQTDSQVQPIREHQEQLISQTLPQIDPHIKSILQPQVELLSHPIIQADPQVQSTIQSQVHLVSQNLPQIDPQRQLQSEFLPRPEIQPQPTLI